jgi:hypothetical protein
MGDQYDAIRKMILSQNIALRNPAGFGPEALTKIRIKIKEEKEKTRK